MELISGKNLCKLIYNTLETFDGRPVAHGQRTSYILYRMLKDTRKYEKYQLADLDFIATLHDIGAYATENLNDTLNYETRESLRHSVYGFLFMKYLSPFEEYSKILLYHHSEYNQTQNIQYPYKDLAMYLHVAERTEIYRKALGKKMNFEMFNKYVDVKYSQKSLFLINQAQSNHDIFGRVEDGSYLEELDELREYQIFHKDDHKKLIEFLIYCLGFRSEETCADAIHCVGICKELAKKLTLSEEDATILYYAAVVHDLGMISIPTEIVDAPRKLTKEELEVIRTHVDCTGMMIEGKFKQKVVDVAKAHHERLDGSGYPLGLTAANMTLPMTILQVADMTAALIGKEVTDRPDSRRKYVRSCWMRQKRAN